MNLWLYHKMKRQRAIATSDFQLPTRYQQRTHAATVTEIATQELDSTVTVNAAPTQ